MTPMTKARKVISGSCASAGIYGFTALGVASFAMDIPYVLINQNSPDWCPGYFLEAETIAQERFDETVFCAASAGGSPWTAVIHGADKLAQAGNAHGIGL